MTILIPTLLTMILSMLAGVHVYWAVSGSAPKWSVVPEANGKPLFTPSRPATLLVAAALFAAAFVAASRGQLVAPAPPGSLAHWAALSAGILFLLRAIGEFRYVGFFKRHRDTRFAKLDTWLYSPLCIFIGLSFLFILTLP